MPVFKDAENKVYRIVTPGDYILRVSKFDIMIQNGGKTSGSEKYEVELEIEQDGQIIGTADENLIDHPTTDWKIDTFLKSAGVQIAKDQAFEFNQVKAQNKGVAWVNPIGLRLWAAVKNEEWIKKNQDGTPKKKADGTPEVGVSNRVLQFITNKEKLQTYVPKLPGKPQLETDGDPNWG